MNENNLTAHSLDRIADRLSDAGISAANQRKLAAVLNHAAARTNGSTAIEVLDLGTQVNKAWGDRSNGNLVFAIVRGGKVVTTFLRRSTQTNTPKALRVDKVRTLKSILA